MAIQPTTFSDPLVDASYGTYLRLIELSNKEKCKQFAIGFLATIPVMLQENQALNFVLKRGYSINFPRISKGSTGDTVSHVLMCIVVSICEEILCRKLIPASLKQDEEDAYYTGICSFTAIHTPKTRSSDFSLSGTFVTGVVGLCLAIIHKRFGLLASITTNCVKNFIPLLIQPIGTTPDLKLISTVALTVIFTCIIIKLTEPLVRRLAEKENRMRLQNNLNVND